MNPEAQRLIAQVRLARTPGADDKERVRRALALALTAGAVSVPAIATGAAAAKSAAAAGGIGVGSAVGAAGLTAGAKLLMSVALVASLGGGAYFWAKRAPAPSHSFAVVAPVAAPIAAAPAAAEAPPALAELPASEAPAPTVTSSRDPLLAELSLLHKAQQAWRTGGARGATQALELAQLHARRYPHSTLRLERDALRLFALCSLGRRAQARPLAAELLKRAPDSPLRTSVEESCGRR